MACFSANQNHKCCEMRVVDSADSCLAPQGSPAVIEMSPIEGSAASSSIPRDRPPARLSTASPTRRGSLQIDVPGAADAAASVSGPATTRRVSAARRRSITASTTPGGKAHVQFFGSNNGRLHTVNAVVPADHGGDSAQGAVEVVIAGANVKIKGAVGSAAGTSHGESEEEEENYGDDDAAPYCATLCQWLPYVLRYPKGDIWGHLDVCIEPRLRRSLANSGGGCNTLFSRVLLVVVWLRKLSAAIVSSRLVDGFILFVILVSSLNLALQEPRIDSCKTLPLSDPENCIYLANYLSVTDIVITAIFAAEAALQVFARGIAFTPFSYMHGPWRLLDGLVVSVSIAAVVGGSASLQSLRALRALRAMRALRGLSRFPHLKLVVDAMIVAIPKARCAAAASEAPPARVIALAPSPLACVQIRRDYAAARDLPLRCPGAAVLPRKPLRMQRSARPHGGGVHRRLQCHKRGRVLQLSAHARRARGVRAQLRRRPVPAGVGGCSGKL